MRFQQVAAMTPCSHRRGHWFESSIAHHLPLCNHSEITTSAALPHSGQIVDHDFGHARGRHRNQNPDASIDLPRFSFRSLHNPAETIKGLRAICITGDLA